MTKITVTKNGPYLVEVDALKIVDWNGNEYPLQKGQVALCRCGESSTRPFCDGTHKKVGFLGDEPAPATPVTKSSSPHKHD